MIEINKNQNEPFRVALTMLNMLSPQLCESKMKNKSNLENNKIYRNQFT